MWQKKIMLYFVSHKNGGVPENIERAKQITHDLQVKDLSNTYICPLIMFSHLRYGEIGCDAEKELCLDILSSCDTLILASEVSEGMKAELDFAKMVGMEVTTLEENGALRPFAE